jgi:autophagy-related protein 18
MPGIGICEMLFSSSLIAISGSGNYSKQFSPNHILGEDPSLSPRKLMILNTKSKATICDLNFVTPILAVKMNKKRFLIFFVFLLKNR